MRKCRFRTESFFLVDRETGADLAYVAADLVSLVVEIGRCLPDELSDVEHFRLAEAAGGNGRGADTLAGGDERLPDRSDGVLVRSV